MGHELKEMTCSLRSSLVYFISANSYRQETWGGAYNLNILLETATGPYVLRTYRPWVLDEHLAFLQHLKYIIQRSGLPVPLPLSSSTGETFVRHTVIKLATPVQFALWVLAHRYELADLFSKRP
jgi:Ser/Thr protein kinase RdoA (MazF antagonist)